MFLMLNGQTRAIPPDWAEDSLLSLLRDHFGLTGAKYGCGQGLCGACTVILDGAAVRSCQVTAGSAAGATLRTVEGLTQGDALHPVQAASLDMAVPQCGYCQAGQIMAAVALLETVPRPTDDGITAAMDGNLCRCGTYCRIRAATRRAAEAA